MEIASNTPVGRYVTEARSRFEDRDLDGCDNAYRKAVQEAADRPALREHLQKEHLTRLLKLGKRALALERSETYLDEQRPGPLGLRVQHAEILSALGHHARADTVAVDLAAHERELSKEQLARTHRVRGLALANDGRMEQARSHLRASRRRFDELGLHDHRDQLRRDMDMLLGREGHEPPLPGRPPETAPDHLHRSEWLRHRARYEEAFDTLRLALDLPDLEPALYWPVLREMTVLAWALRRPGLVERLGPLLWEAADQAPAPVAARAEAGSLLMPGTPEESPAARRFDARIEHVGKLLHDERLDEAEDHLEELRERAGSPRDIALWHLAAAQAEQGREELSGDPRHLHECAGHAALAVAYAWPNALLEVRIAALRIMGDAHAALELPDSDDHAVEYWAEARRLEEDIASRQPTDAVRVTMLRAAPDEHDARVHSAVKRTQRLETPTAAGIAVAVEAARGAQILPQILSPEEHRTRVLPSPSDWTGARHWLGTMAAALPRDQAAWLIHATPGQVHHVIVCRDLFRHVYVESDRCELCESLDDLARCWDQPWTLEASVESGEFDRRLAHVAARLGIGKVTGLLPPHVRRLAVVAGNEVSDAPLAALPLPDGGGPLGLRYALSDLPCLSALVPLRRRSAGRRGDVVLLVQPGNGRLTPAGIRARGPLLGPDATPRALGGELAKRRHRIVRIDAHGSHEHDDARRSIIELSPEGEHGHLRAGELERMDLRGCGTLVLGACESGMAQRLGHDERQGFVRAGVNAGAAAVVAARWIAPDAPAAALLDRFHRHLRRLPRDLALHAAMRDICAMDIDMASPHHPSRWACWSLYGDAGLQTKAGPLRRWMRGLPGPRAGRSGAGVLSA